MYKRIGIVGGVSPQSSALFYSKIIEKHFKKFQNQYYPEIVMFSVNFDKVKDLQKLPDQEEYINEFVKAIESLANAGADFAVIASNTPHRIFSELASKTSINLLSIVDCVTNHAKHMKYNKVLLLGTIYTMRENYFKNGFKAEKIETIVPSDEEQEMINDIIFNELVIGENNEKSKSYLINLIKRYPADAVILGCTELPMIIKKEDISIPIIDSTDIFAEATLNFALL